MPKRNDFPSSITFKRVKGRVPCDGHYLTLWQDGTMIPAIRFKKGEHCGDVLYGPVELPKKKRGRSAKA